MTTDLDAIAAQIREEHDGALSAFNSGLAHAMKCGALLIEAKAALPHGGWLPWLKEHVPFSERTANNYMALARGRERLDLESATLADLTITGALDRIEERSPPKSWQQFEPRDPAIVLQKLNELRATAEQIDLKTFAGSITRETSRAEIEDLCRQAARAMRIFEKLRMQLESFRGGLIAKEAARGILEPAKAA